MMFPIGCGKKMQWEQAEATFAIWDLPNDVTNVTIDESMIKEKRFGKIGF